MSFRYTIFQTPKLKEHNWCTNVNITHKTSTWYEILFAEKSDETLPCAAAIYGQIERVAASRSVYGTISRMTQTETT